MIALDRSVLVGRAGALAILASLGVLAWPFVTSPFLKSAARQEAIEIERTVLAQAEARFSMVTDLAGDVPTVHAATRDEAYARMGQALAAAASGDAIRLTSLSPYDSRQSGPVIDIDVIGEATPSGLASFAAALANGEPKMVVKRFRIAADPPAGTDEAGTRRVRMTLQLTASSFFVADKPR